MATVTRPYERLVLDAGGVLALARGDARAWSRLSFALKAGAYVVVPTPVVAQVHRGGRRGAAVSTVLKSVDRALPTSEAVARTAGQLLGATGRSDAVDGIVVAEALALQPSMIMTSDPADLRAILAGQPDRARVGIIGV